MAIALNFPKHFESALTLPSSTKLVWEDPSIATRLKVLKHVLDLGEEGVTLEFMPVAHEDGVRDLEQAVL